MSPERVFRATMPWWRFALIGLLALAIVGISLLNVLRQESAKLVRHTIETQSAAKHLLLTLVNAETGQRGYLVTGNEAFLEPYNKARQLLDGDFANLARLISDNPDQLETLGKMRLSASKRLELLELGIGYKRSGQDENAADTQRLLAGKREMDAIREHMSTFLDTEREVLNQRQAEMAFNNGIASAATAVLIALILILIAAEANHARAIARELTQENQKLDVLVAERTQALEREKTRVQAFLADLNHRIGNTLVMATALINMQARKSTDENVKKALGESVERIRAIAASQRRLQLDAESDSVQAAPYIDNVLEELRGLAEARGVKIATYIGDITLPGKQAVSYVLLINELVVNALKHAFADFEQGAITVSMQREVTDAGGLALVVTVTDDGIGLRPDAGSGVGNSVITLLVRSMNGTVRNEPASPGGKRPGLRTIITIPEAETEV